jgi:hypothetical protein
MACGGWFLHGRTEPEYVVQSAVSGETSRLAQLTQERLRARERLESSLFVLESLRKEPLAPYQRTAPIRIDPRLAAERRHERGRLGQALPHHG